MPPQPQWPEWEIPVVFFFKFRHGNYLKKIPKKGEKKKKEKRLGPELRLSLKLKKWGEAEVRVHCNFKLTHFHCHIFSWFYFTKREHCSEIKAAFQQNFTCRHFQYLCIKVPTHGTNYQCSFHAPCFWQQWSHSERKFELIPDTLTFQSNDVFKSKFWHCKMTQSTVWYHSDKQCVFPQSWEQN